MQSYPSSVEKLIFNLKKIPGIGNKSAERIAFFMIYEGKSYLKNFEESLQEIQSSLKLCSQCFAFTQEHEHCDICRNEFRNKELLCVVESFKDIIVFENMGQYDGLYHVLEGKISILDNITPDKLQINSLVERVKNNNIKEIIMSTSLSMEGDSTACYISDLLKPFNVKISRLAKGLSVGLQLENADNMSLMSAFNNRETML